MARYALLFLILLCSCSKLSLETNWTKESHSNNVPLNYPQVLPEAEVRSITITLGKDKWAAISKDMLYRTARNFGDKTVVPGITPPAANGSLDAVPGDPVFVESTVKQDNKNWQNVGFRLKGNASLNGSWQNGIYKLPFKLKFDIKNQRFYGFKELSFAPCYGDNTFMKDKLVAELFRAGGIATAKSAFYKVYIDFGEGIKYCGVYHAIEVIENTMIIDQFGDATANVYKPETDLLTFDARFFEKQNNITTANYKDAIEFVYALNHTARTTDPQKWKTDLESKFDVDYFLKYLAINNTIANWDSYGVLKHNYYMVNNKGKLTWVPYDLNLSMQLRGGANNARFALSFDMKEVTNAWPLIRYIIDQPEYYNTYKKYVKEYAETVYVPTKINAKIDRYYALIKPFVNGIEPEQPKYSHLSNLTSFDTGITDMKNFISNRYVSVNEFVK
jgi:spore coat protein H